MSSEEIAYRDLEPGELYQDGDEWQADNGRWIKYVSDLVGTPHPNRRSRRPYNITQMLQKPVELMRLNEDLNHELQTLRPRVEALQDQCEQLQAALEAARKSPDFAEVSRRSCGGWRSQQTRLIIWLMSAFTTRTATPADLAQQLQW